MKYKVAKTMCFAAVLTILPTTGAMAMELNDGKEPTVLEDSSLALTENEVPLAEFLPEEVPVEKEQVEEEVVEKEAVEKEAVEKEGIEKEGVEKEVVEKEAVEKEVVEKEAVEKEAVEKEAVEKEAVEKEAVEEGTVEEVQAGKVPVEKEETPLEATLIIHHVLHVDDEECVFTEEIGNLETKDLINEADYILKLKEENIQFIGKTKDINLIQGKNEITLDYGVSEKEQSKKSSCEER